MTPITAAGAVQTEIDRTGAGPAELSEPLDARNERCAHTEGGTAAHRWVPALFEREGS